MWFFVFICRSLQMKYCDISLNMFFKKRNMKFYCGGVVLGFVQVEYLSIIIMIQVLNKVECV